MDANGAQSYVKRGSLDQPRPRCLDERLPFKARPHQERRCIPPHDGRNSAGAMGSTSAPTPSCSSTVGSGFEKKKIQDTGVRGLFWEIFSGSGRLSDMVQKLCGGMLAPFDISTSSIDDLTKRSTQDVIKKFLAKKIVKVLHMGAPCTVFVLSCRHGRRNHNRVRERERVGCKLAFLSGDLTQIAHGLDIFWRIENPTSSQLWEFPAIQELWGLRASFALTSSCAVMVKLARNQPRF